MKKRLIGLALLCSMSVAGCGGKKELDYNSELANQNMVTEARTAAATEDISDDTSDNSDKGTVKDGQVIVNDNEVKYWLDLKYGEVCVDADVTRQGASGYPEASVSRKEYSVDDVKAMADKFFDNASYYQTLFPLDANYTYLNDRQKQLEEYKTANGHTDSEYYYWEDEALNDIEHFGEFSQQNQDFGTRVEEGNIQYITAYSEKNQELMNHEYIYLEGLHNGEIYNMKFIVNNDLTMVEIYKNGVSAYSYTFDALDVNNMDSIKADVEHWGLEIASEDIVDEEKARDIAVEYLDKLGIEGYTPIDNLLSCVQAEAKKEQGINGSVEFVYNIVFSKTVNDKTKISSNMTWPCNKDSVERLFDYDRSIYSNMIQRDIPTTEYVVVTVDKDGFNRLCLVNPIDIDEITNQEANLMSFEEINEIAKHEMETSNQFNANDNVVIDTVTLGIGEVNDNGNRRLVPVWYYAYDDNKKLTYNDGDQGSTLGLFLDSSVRRTKKVAVMINAIDGTVIKEAK